MNFDSVLSTTLNQTRGINKSNLALERAENRTHHIQKHLNAATSSIPCAEGKTNATMARSPITSHVLDTSIGKPAGQVLIELEILDDVQKKWVTLGKEITNEDGRVTQLIPVEGFQPGTYRVIFHTKEYFERMNVSTYFYPHVVITFCVKNPQEHYHVPLLINPFGYSTYRGS